MSQGFRPNTKIVKHEAPGTLRLMDKILHYFKYPKLWGLWYILIMGNAGFCPSTVSTLLIPLELNLFTLNPLPTAYSPWPELPKPQTLKPKA